ncbi:MAG: hypothetical protein LC798_10750 [Chloroflexi bacterium]|nr:hypothetical protein [Chloroflexota bacterium]
MAEQAQADAASVLAHEGLVGVDDPLGELARLATEARAFQAALARRVNAAPGVENRSGDLRSEIAAYERAMDRCGRFLVALVSAGFEEKRVRLAEQQGQLLVAGLQWLAARLELDERRLVLWQEHTPAMLRLLAAGEIPTIEGGAE